MRIRRIRKFDNDLRFIQRPLSQPLSVRDTIWLNEAFIFYEKQKNDIENQKWKSEYETKRDFAKLFCEMYGNFALVLSDLRHILLDIDTFERAGKVKEVLDINSLPSVQEQKADRMKNKRAKRADEYTDEERKKRAEAFMNGAPASSLVEYVDVQ